MAWRELADDFKAVPGDAPVGGRLGVTDVEIQEAIRNASAFLDLQQRGVANGKNGHRRNADRSDDNGPRNDLTKLERLLDLANSAQQLRPEDLRRVVPEEKRDHDIPKYPVS